MKFCHFYLFHLLTYYSNKHTTLNKSIHLHFSMSYYFKVIPIFYILQTKLTGALGRTSTFCSLIFGLI